MRSAGNAPSSEGALPELAAPHDIQSLAKHLEVAALDPTFPIVKALADREDIARERGEFLTFEEARLVWVFDQLGELYTLPEISPAQRQSFVQCLKALARSGPY